MRQTALGNRMTITKLPSPAQGADSLRDIAALAEDGFVRSYVAVAICFDGSAIYAHNGESQETLTQALAMIGALESIKSQIIREWEE